MYVAFLCMSHTWLEPSAKEEVYLEHQLCKFSKTHGGWSCSVFTGVAVFSLELQLLHFSKRLLRTTYMASRSQGMLLPELGRPFVVKCAKAFVKNERAGIFRPNRPSGHRLQ
ncbi:unnamed protein product [Sphagnum troendelagicum]|uniref:Uncharacterized protein n=1 Tax=Sphagnum troendelagicum TaxID=128251 RepID=A0ABP0UVQ7_9BRYO